MCAGIDFDFLLDANNYSKTEENIISDWLPSQKNINTYYNKILLFTPNIQVISNFGFIKILFVPLKYKKNPLQIIGNYDKDILIPKTLKLENTRSNFSILYSINSMICYCISIIKLRSKSAIDAKILKNDIIRPTTQNVPSRGFLIRRIHFWYLF